MSRIRDTTKTGFRVITGGPGGPLGPYGLGMMSIVYFDVFNGFLVSKNLNNKKSLLKYSH